MKRPNCCAWVACALVLVSAGSVEIRAQTRLVEKVEAAPGRIVIPYTKYVLANGLTLIVHEDRSDPLVHVDVTYHVGSAREEIGKSGFAHFFEHMMFQGSDHVGDDQHFKIVTESGGRLNGSTNRDRTNYYETTPVNQLEKILWLEADRMGFFLDAVTQRKFEVQRDTVKNERGQNYDNRPYGLVYEVISRNLYPYGHPYSWLTIGYIEDLNRVNVDDLKNFFLRWYGPNNATLTVGGDVNAGEVLKMVEKYFGPIPRGPEVKPTQVPPARPEGDRYVTLVDNYARQPRLLVVLPSVPAYHPDEYPLDCLAEILGQGKNSILYQELVKDQKVLSASAGNSCTELSGEFVFSITPSPTRSLAETKKLYDDAIKAFEARGVTDEDIARFTGSIEANLINGLQSVSAKVSQLAQFQTFTGNPNYIGVQLEKYTNVTKADVQRVYEKYVKGKPAVILSVATKSAPTNVVAAENYTINKEGYHAPDYGYAGLKYEKPKDSFERDKMPPSGANPTVKVPPFWREKLASGVEMIGSESRELPIVALTFSMPGGHLTQAEDLSKAGLAQMFGRMMNEDTQDRTAEQFQTALQSLGSSVYIGSGLDEISVSMQSLKKNLDKTLALVEERLLRPKFTTAAFERIKKQTLEGFKLRKSQPAAVASEVFDKLNYGAGNIFGIAEVGTEETVRNLTLKDVEDYYARSLTRRGARLSVVGDIAQKEIISKLGFLAQLPDREIKLPTVATAPKVEKSRIYLVDVPKAAQTEFRVGYVTGLKYDATGDYYRAGLANYALGGMFSSRLNLNLREDKAWTYGARSGFSGDKYTGTFAFSSGIRSDATAQALGEVLKELGTYASAGPTQEELEFTRRAIGQADALRYETPLQKAGFIMRMLEYGLSADYVEQQNKILAKIDQATLAPVAGKWFQTNAMNILLVGDKEKIQPGLKETGFELIELDVNGERTQGSSGAGGGR
jgi:zinc protease